MSNFYFEKRFGGTSPEEQSSDIQSMSQKPKDFLGMEGVEPPTLWFVAIDSNPLSYIPFFTGKALGENQSLGIAKR